MFSLNSTTLHFYCLLYLLYSLVYAFHFVVKYSFGIYKVSFFVLVVTFTLIISVFCFLCSVLELLPSACQLITSLNFHLFPMQQSIYPTSSFLSSPPLFFLLLLSVCSEHNIYFSILVITLVLVLDSQHLITISPFAKMSPVIS